MNLLSGLEKYGLKVDDKKDIFAEERHSTDDQQKDSPQQEILPVEEDFLLEKSIRCPVCDVVFKTIMVKSGRIKRMEPDADLRPRFQFIDTLKYDVSSCPQCGYTGMNRYFEHLSTGQIRMIQEGVCKNFKPQPVPKDEGVSGYDYDTAIERYKLALYNTIVKKGKTSERAYACLKISWLYRGKGEGITENTPEAKKELEACREEEEAFYTQAYEGFVKAVATEMFPMCGMDQTTVDYLIASMAYRLGKMEIASKLVSRILTSRTASNKIKDKALTMKEEILSALRSNK